jgi:DNA polymerase-3 subunit delta
MIHKSYLIENNLTIIKNNIVLFYGENLGLINHFKEKIILSNKKDLLLRFTQEEILKHEEIFFNEIKNISLFEERKIIFILDAGDKIFKTLEEVLPIIGENKLFLFSGLLDKKSKLRAFFEKNKETDIVPCYQDNELTIKKIIINNLKDFSGVTTQAVNTIIECCSTDRVKLNNEINKIKVFFLNKKIIFDDLNKLLNIRQNDDFNLIKDYALNGNKIKTNVLLNSTIIESEKSVYYIATVNQRLSRLKQVIEKKNNDLEKIIDSLKPPIFWKDKPNFVQQAKLWNLNKLNKALNNTYDVELRIKSNSNLNKEIILKKLIVDICNLANA